MQKEEPVQVPLAGEPLELEPEDILVESISKEGISGAEGNGMLVALDTELTRELIQEGLVRDLVRNVQELRKQSGLNIIDRIELFVDGAGGDLSEAIANFRDYIEQETLAVLAEAPATGASKGATAAGEGKESISGFAGEMEAKIEKDTVRLSIRVRQ